MDDEKRIYSEVLGVLLALGNDYCEKVPSSVFTFLEDNCDHNYLPEYDKNTRIEDLKITDEARMFLVMLKIKYWCKDEKEREELRQILKDNESKYNKEIREKYNPDKIFEKDSKEENINDQDKDKDSVDYEVDSNDKLITEEKKGWFSKFLNKLKSFFKK